MHTPSRNPLRIQDAKERYDDALAGGHGGFLLSEERETQDIFSLRVGNLPPQSVATVKLTYVAQVDEEADEPTEGKKGSGGDTTLRFVLPTAVAPRYAPAMDAPPELQSHAEAFLASWPKDLLKVSGSVATGAPILGLVPHTFKEECGYEILGQQQEGGNAASYRATFAFEAGHLDEDFVLSVRLQGRLPDRAWVDKATGAATIAAGLRPGQLLEDGEGEEEEEEEEEEEAASPGEYVFVIDRSGSMAGSQIAQAREALALCTSALPVGARFQIIGFGNDFAKLFPGDGAGSVAFDDATKATALDHCRTLDADMGGTEILRPLQAIAEVAPSAAAPRQVFVITDGQVS